MLGLILALGLAPAAWGAIVPPKPTHFVTDEAGALESDTATQLERELREYETATGHQIIVYIGETTGKEPLENYTVNAAQSWKVGRKGKDDGVVLFLFMRDRRVRIEVGYGLEGDLPDARAKQIVDETIVPRLKDDDTDGAVASGVAAILTTISPHFQASQPVSAAAAPQSSSDGDGSDDQPAWFGILLFVGFVPVVMLVMGVLRWLFTLPKGLKAADTAFITTPRLFFSGSGSSSSDGDEGVGSSDFSGGGGSFGGGGASGSW
jgi:uncharacterized protein